MQNVNALSPIGYSLGITKLPGIGFYSQQVTLPGISLPEINQANPFVDAYVPGEKLAFEPFTMNFMIDENMDNYYAIYAWLIGLGFPNNYEEFIDGNNRNLVHMSDGFLQILGSNNAVVRTIKFTDMFPTNLNTLQFASTESDVVYLQGTVEFRYTSFKFV